MYECWHDYVQAKLCYIDTNSFIVLIKTDDIYQNIGKDVRTRFDTSNWEHL